MQSEIITKATGLWVLHPRLFEGFEYSKGKTFEFKSGKVFDPEHREAVVGSYVAQKTGLKKGSKFSAFAWNLFRQKQRTPGKV